MATKTKPKLETVFDMLKNSRRKRVVEQLEQQPDIDLRSLSLELAKQEGDDAEPIAKRRKRVYIALYQSHMPKLDAAGVVDFDGDRKTISTGDHFDHVVGVLQAARVEHEGGKQPSATTRVRQLLTS